LGDKITTVPGPKHVVVQALLEYHIKYTCPKGYRVTILREAIFGPGEEFRADVMARYFKPNGLRVIIYEVQKDLNLKSFKEKMQRVRETGVTGEIIELDKVPDDIIEASKYLGTRILLP
jgi:hypothetical protein